MTKRCSIDLSETCDFCKKEGLAILPVRFAVAPQDSNAPKMYGNMLPRGCETAHDLGAHAYYTTRILRTGYLYVFDEKRNLWSGYLITEGGYFMPFNVSKPVPAATEKTREPCNRSGHREIASCITITSPSEAGDVWIAYSEVEWTPKTLELHQNVDFRKRHMTKLEIPKILSEDTLPAGEPIRRISAVKETVAEYTRAEYSKFISLPAPWKMRVTEAEQLICASDLLYPGKGIIVALNDPTLIAAELSALMGRFWNDFMAIGRRFHYIKTEGWLSSLEAQIKENAQRARLDAAAEARERYEGPRLPGLFSATSRASLELSLGNMDTAEQLDQVAERAWEKYGRKINQQEREAWIEQYQKDSAAFDKSHILPLAKAHAEWAQSMGMQNYLGCNFDETNIESGFAYLAALTNAFEGTGDKLPSLYLYKKWLTETEISQGNLIYKALTFNQETLSKAIAALPGKIGWGDVPWDKLIETFDKVTETVIAGKPDALGKFIGTIAGAAAELTKEAVNSPQAYKTLAALGVAARQPVVRVEIEGSKKSFRAVLIRETLRAGMRDPVSGKQINRLVMDDGVRRAFSAEMRRLHAYGVPLQGTEKRHWLLMIDLDAVHGMPSGLTKSQQAEWLARTIRTPEQIEALNLQNYRDQVARGEIRMKAVLNPAGKAVRYSAPMGFAVLGVIANAYSWQKLIDQDKNAMQHKHRENLARLWSQGMQLAGATSLAIEQGIKKIAMPLLRGARGTLNLAARIASAGGKLLGTAGSILMSLVDFWLASKELSQGNDKAAGAYFVSGFLGFGIAVALWFGFTTVGLLLIVAMIAWAFVMNVLVDNPLQEWMERCSWGKGERYGDSVREEIELEKALGVS